MTDHLVLQFANSMLRDMMPNNTGDAPVLAIAVSGGADSFALLHLALSWCKNRPSEQQPRIIAVTVDHHLRPASTDEAQHVATWCKHHHVEHHILDWHGPKPTSGIQNSARIMRRTLLSEFCHARNIHYLLLGHQADDQAETFFMRLQRGSGATGLSAMKSHVHHAQYDLHILRPLLSLRRADLRQYCERNKIPFLDDPSNENTDFERVRIRQDLAAFPHLADGITRATLRLQRAEQALLDMAQKWCTNHIQNPDAQIYWIPYDAFTDMPSEIRMRILIEIVSRITQQEMPSLRHIEDWEYHITQPHFTGMNIMGCWARPKTLNHVQGIAFQAEPVRKQI